MDRPSDPRSLDEGDLASHALFLRRLARRLVRDDARADDLAQETWRAALSNPPREVGSWRGWLAATARNVARQMARGGARRARHEQAAAPRERLPSTEEVAARLEAERRLIDAVAALPDDDRALILLRHFDGLPPRAIARRMQAPVETVKTRLKRALERLRARLVERGGDSRRLHSGLLLVANGLVGKVGATGGVVAGVLAMTVKGKVGIALTATAVIVVALQVVRSRDDRRRHASAVAQSKGARAAAVQEPARDEGVDAISASRAAEAALETTANVAATNDSNEPATEITGRIVDLDGRPLEGVEICSDLRTQEWPPRRIHGDSWPSTRTDSEGRFTWRRPPANPGVDARGGWGNECPGSGWGDAISVSFDAWATGYVPGRFTVNAASGRSQDVGNLKLFPECRIGGRVNLPKYKETAAATVLLERIDGNFMPALPTLMKPERYLMSTQCEPDGRFELGGLGGGRYRLWASLPDSYFTPYEPVDVAGGQAANDLALRLEMPPDDDSTFRVRVLSPKGEPVERAWVCVSYREGRRSSVLTFPTDVIGRVVVPTHGLPIQFVEAWPPDPTSLHARQDFEGRVPEECELRLGEPEQLVLHVRSADATPLEYVVVDGEQWFSDEQQASGRCDSVGNWTADADGRVEVRLPKGMVELRVRSNGFVDASVGPLRFGDALRPIEVALTPAPSFEGRVTFEGRPIAGAVVLVAQLAQPGRACSPEHAPSRACRTGHASLHPTGPDGRFRVCGPDVGVVILLRASASGFAASELGPFDLAVSRSATNLEFELTRGGSISGVVLPGRDGARARLVVLSNGDGFPRSWPVAADGTFRVDHLTPGPWNVRTHDAPLLFEQFWNRFDCGALDELPSNCVVREGETTTLTISSDDTLDCFVRGEVTGLRDETTPYWLKWWHAWIGPSERSDEEIAWDENGEMPGVPFDGDRFEIRRDWLAASDLVLAQRLDGLDRSCVITLRQPWRLEQGIAHWSAKLALGGIEGRVAARVSASLHVEADATTADGFRFHARVRVNDGGGFSVPRVPAGEVRMHLEGSGVEQMVTVAAGETTQVALR